ncbi:Leupeptin-inactivating enzyme 1 precursor [Elizabethkingia miricola]|nr:Leupeptin-inactivating enzyme 1 precursor [Elizabethkingia miricola]
MNPRLLIIIIAFISTLASCEKKDRRESSTSNNSIEQLVDKKNAWEYLEDIQRIADENQNHRSVSSPGGIATANYITNQLHLIGFTPKALSFEFEKKNHEKIKGQNIIVDITGKSDSIIMFGAHYDSVEMGPGINDNATGVAILLELASALEELKIKPEKTIRFAFWDAEEEGVIGSSSYIKNLPELEKNKITSYINIDMVGTKDPDILILDGDGNSFKQMREDLKKNGMPDKEINKMVGEMEKRMPKPKPGSAELEKIIDKYLKDKNIKYKDDIITSLSTDTASFFQLSPTSGIVMTHDILQKDGSLLFAPCYHQACDDIKNVNRTSFNIALGLISHLVDKLAYVRK